MDKKKLKRNLVALFFIFHFLSIFVLVFTATYLIIDIGHIPEFDNPNTGQINYIKWIEMTDPILVITFFITLILWFYSLIVLIIKLFTKKINKNHFLSFLYFSLSLLIAHYYFWYIGLWLTDS